MEVLPTPVHADIGPSIASSHLVANESIEMVCLDEPCALLPAVNQTASVHSNTSPSSSSLSDQTNDLQTNDVPSQRLSSLTLTHTSSSNHNQTTLDQLCVKKKRPSTATLSSGSSMHVCSSGLASTDTNNGHPSTCVSTFDSSNSSIYNGGSQLVGGHHLLHKRARVMSSNPLHNAPLFNKNTGLPLSSSPVPQRKPHTFSFENSVKQPNALRRVLLDKDPENDENFKNQVIRKITNLSPVTNSLLGSFEESVLNGRLQPVNIIYNGFRAQIGTSGLISGRFYCPDHLKMPVTVYFYNVHENEQHFASPYLAKVSLGKKGYQVPRKGTVQVTLFNPQENVVKMFVIQYDLSDMPKNSQSFVRQKILFMPKSIEPEKASATYLRYLIHLRFISSRSGKIYLHRDIRMLVFRRNDYDPHLLNGGSASYHWATLTQQPSNPSYSFRC